MTPPRNCLSAHDRYLFPRGESYQHIEILAEFGSLHVIRISPETTVAPGAVDRIRSRPPEPSQPAYVRIMHPGFFQSSRQLILIELRIVPGPRDRAYIHQPLHLVRLQKLNELASRTRRMADRQNHAIAPEKAR